MLQLSREELLKCYTRMRTIREFEDRVHEEFATGKIPGFVHLYAGEEASAVGVCTKKKTFIIQVNLPLVGHVFEIIGVLETIFLL